ncbi:IPT/TIG domain-containing protein [Vitiosangium sp. GDMCC 1.1324]|uniref:IPT/TIG domain-containing protein n=1 Tax=Vitiosangium sp. (strain GDMCC 1.1324) TaxID=2138576 RepID=UPI00130EB0CD|nr:IPT/TIG domain-containing protein [Vitiosangium sp. GDMCC 1.1324]
MTTTTTNDWDAVIGLTEDFFSTGIDNLYKDGSIPTQFDYENNGLSISATLGEPTVALDATSGLVNITLPITSGTLSGQSGPATSISGPVTVGVKVSTLSFATVIQQNYLKGTGGTGAYAQCITNKPLSGGAATLEMWLRTLSTEDQTLLSFPGSGGAASPGLSLRGGQLVVDWGAEYVCTTPLSITDGQWHHVAVAFDAGLLFFYVDGMMKCEVAFAMPELTSGASLMMGGAPGGAPSLDGALAQVRIWNVVRTAPQLQLAMNCHLPVPQSGLIGSFDFDGSVKNAVTGAKGSVTGGATLVTEDTKNLPFSVCFYCFALDEAFTVTSDINDNPRVSQSVNTLVQSFLESTMKPYSVIAQGTAAGGAPGDSSNPYAPILPTTSCFQVSSVAGKPELLIVMMTANTVPPSTDVSTAFASDPLIQPPSGSNITIAISDYALFDRLLMPALASALDVSTSAFDLTKDPAVLSLAKDVDYSLKKGLSLTITDLMSKVVEKGLYLRAAGETFALEGSGSVTVNFSVVQAEDGTRGISLAFVSPDIDLHTNDQGFFRMAFLAAVTAALAAVAVILVPLSPFIAEILLAILNSLLGRISKKLEHKISNAGTTANIEKDKNVLITLNDIVYNGGVVFYFGLTDIVVNATAEPVQTAPEVIASGGPPSITGFSPTTGAPGTAVTVTGSGFSGALGVTLGGAPAAVFQIKNDGQIVAKVGDGAVTGPVVVTTPAGSATSSGKFSVLTPPVVASFSPTSGKVGTGVTLTGSGFTGATQVSFGGTLASFTVKTDSQLVATVPSNASTGLIVVTGPAGKSNSTSIFQVTSSTLPVIQAITPSSGSEGTTVTLSGEGFTGTRGVTFNGKGATFQVLSDTQLSTTVPPRASTGPVVVTNTVGASKDIGFTVLPGPALSGFSPTLGTPGTSITLHGSGFTGATSVTIGRPATAASSFSVNSDTQIMAVVPSGIAAGPVTVTTPGGSVVSSDSFAVQSVGKPTLSGFSPASAGVGATITLEGTNFTGTTQVTFAGNAAAPFTLRGDGLLDVVVPNQATSGLLHVTNTVDTAASSQSFTVLAAPKILGFTPATGTQGTPVTITGSGFTGTTYVAFGGGSSPATISVRSDTQITTTVPSGAVSGLLVVEAPGGVAMSQGSFTVKSSTAPTLTGFTPAVGMPGLQVTVTGTGFTGTTSVKFNGIEATSYNVASDTTLVARVPQGATTGPITVTNTLSPPATSSASFQVGTATANAA